MVFAIAEINRIPLILPNITVGFNIYDSCYSDIRTIQSAMAILSGNNDAIPNFACRPFIPLAGIIGDLVSSLSITLARILGIYRVPQISHGAVHSRLSNKQEFPSFLRTIPGMVFQDYALAQIIDHFGWKWVGILTADNDLGQSSTQNLKTEIQRSGACVAFTEKIYPQYSKEKFHKIAELVIKSSVNIIIINSDEVYARVTLDALKAHNITEKTLILSALCTITPGFFTKQTWSLINGALGLTPSTNDMPGFNEFLYNARPSESPKDVFLRTFWKEYFKCDWPVKNDSQTENDEVLNKEMNYCTGNEHVEDLDANLFELNDLSYTFHAYIAVYAFTHALDNLIRYSPGNGSFHNGSYSNIQNIQPWQIPRSVCSESCPLGYRKNIKEGQPACCFDCSPCSTGEISNQTDANICLKCQDHQWPNDQHDECIPKVADFLSYEETISAFLVTITCFFCFTTATVFCIFIKYRDTPIVKANNRGLSYLLLLSLKLCFLCSFLFIGQPMKMTCVLRQTVFGIMFCISISSLLAKTITVVIAFKATNPNSKLRKWVGAKLPYCVIISCSLVQVILCTVWLLISPPFPEMNLKLPASHITLECNEGQNAFFYCMLGYMGLLAIVSFVVAFLARSLPDSYNEAKYITFSMLVFVSVWLSFIPAYLSTKGKYMVAVEIFAILSSSAGLLGCIFIFKCYIILLQPNLNNKENLTSSEKFSRNRGHYSVSC
ncbi:extracellular calcium-sensing receptor-like [Protopterus annectens]|uniref:extracellular calcium-sensing receptor-like n=1 Tax=Protopterus annectens TaxID=7888 RepID=UPI001CFA0991|nr:extracellular calcium-sensing receptor-like [Protopterus annectens]